MQISISSLMDTSGVAFGTSGARGLASNMTDEVCFAYTAAFLQHTLKRAESGALQAEKATVKKAVAFGGDLRPSTPRIIAACMAAAKHLGFECDFQGFLPSPALALYSIKKGIPSIMVTGSHIPENRNGIKFCDYYGEITKADEQSIRAQTVEMPSEITPETLNAAHDAITLYKNYTLSLFPKNSLAGTKIAFYQHSAVGRDIAVEILTELGAKVTPFARSEKFIPVDTEAIRKEDVELAKEICKNGSIPPVSPVGGENGGRQELRCESAALRGGVIFDCIVSTDGDSDRPLLSDEKGNWLRGDSLGIIAGKALGIEYVSIPVSCNTAAEKSGFFKEVLRTKIGSPFVIEGIRALEKKYSACAETDGKNNSKKASRAPETQRCGGAADIPHVSPAGGENRGVASCAVKAQRCGGAADIPHVSPAGEENRGVASCAVKAQRCGGVAGYEANGGFLTQDLTTRDALTPVISAIIYAKNQNLTLSQLLAKLPQRYTASGLVKEFPPELADKFLAELKTFGLAHSTKPIAMANSAIGGVAGVMANESEATPALIKSINSRLLKVDETDGYRMEFENGDIVHFRKSGNAPEFRCYTESESETRSVSLNEHCIGFLEDLKTKLSQN